MLLWALAACISRALARLADLSVDLIDATLLFLLAIRTKSTIATVLFCHHGIDRVMLTRWMVGISTSARSQLLDIFILVALHKSLKTVDASSTDNLMMLGTFIGGLAASDRLQR